MLKNQQADISGVFLFKIHKNLLLSNSRTIYTQDLNSNQSTIFKPDVDVSNPGCLYPLKDL